MQETLESVLSIFVLILSTTIIGLAKYYIDKYMKIYEQKVVAEIEPEMLYAVEKLARLGVEAAEQMFGVDFEGDKKFAFVANLITTKFPDLDPSIVQAVIESSVLNYHRLREKLLILDD